MNAKELLGKKIIDKKARDLAKLAEINLNTKTLEISGIYGSVGNPISKKYYDIPIGDIIAVGDYIQISKTIEELEDQKMDKIPEAEEGIIKFNGFLGKTILNSEGNITGKVSNIEIDAETNKISSIELEGSSSGFGRSKNQRVIPIENISSIGDYIIVNKVFADEDAEKSEKEEKESVNIDIE